MQYVVHGTPTENAEVARGPRTTRRPKRRLAVVLGLVHVALYALPSGAAQAAPVAAFTVSPGAPLTSQSITFTSESTGGVTTLDWDLDADGQFNDGHGATAQRAYATPGRYLVSLRASGPTGTATQSQWILVGNRPPLASFTYTPDPPAAGQVVSLAAAASDPDGSVAAITWDLNGDGTFVDAAGPVATMAFPEPGAYRVAMRVTDSSGATTVSTQGIAVGPRPPSLLQPFPIVRLTTRSTRHGARVLRLGVQAPPGSRVAIRCIGRSCGTHHQVRIVRTPGRPLRFHALEHRMRAGVVLEIRVTAPGHVGKYTRFVLRRAKPPGRVDMCLQPRAAAPAACPAG